MSLNAAESKRVRRFPSRAIRVSGHFGGLIAGLAMLATGVFTPSAAADEFVSKLNREYASVSKDKRSDLVLLPAFAKMIDPPITASSLEKARQLPATASGFAAAAEWAKAGPQQDVLKAIADVTKEPDWRKAMVFALPYGVDSTPQDIIRTGLYSELGDPPSLAGADHRFLPKFDIAAILVNVEATRLAAEGKPSDAIEVLLNWAGVCRQMADRHFYTEVEWGLSNLLPTLERIRDIAYEDSRNAKAIDTKRLFDQVKRLLPNSYIEVDRLRIPDGDSVAVDQLITRVYTPNGGADEAVFGSTLARLGAGKYPLRLMSESAKWRSAAALQGNIFEAQDASKAAFGDWGTRWTLDYFDRVHGKPTEFSKLDRTRFAVIERATPDYGRLFDLRQLAKVERIGTSHALSLVGYSYTAKAFPPDLSSVRPRWMAKIEDDPFSMDIDTRNRFPLQYFVPIRDEVQNAREEAKPHEMSVVPDSGDPFSVRLRDDTMIVYSVGTDQVRNRAKKVQNTASTVQGADYLIWPPILSLQRQNLIDRGELK